MPPDSLSDGDLLNVGQIWLRRQKNPNLTQDKFSKLFGVSQATYSRKENIARSQARCELMTSSSLDTDRILELLKCDKADLQKDLDRSDWYVKEVKARSDGAHTRYPKIFLRRARSADPDDFSVGPEFDPQCELPEVDVGLFRTSAESSTGSKFALVELGKSPSKNRLCFGLDEDGGGLLIAWELEKARWVQVGASLEKLPGLPVDPTVKLVGRVLFLAGIDDLAGPWRIEPEGILTKGKYAT